MSTCNFIKPVSYAVLLVGLLYGVQKEVLGGEITPLAASIIIIVLIFTLSFYQSFIKTDSDIMTSDIITVMRTMCSALFTTSLFLKEDVIGDMWNYLPLVIGSVLSIIYLMQGNSECDRSFMQLFIMLNVIAQLYVAAKAGNILYAIAAFCLLMGNCMCMEGDGLWEIAPVVWYNFFAGAYCLTANGEGIELKA